MKVRGKMKFEEMDIWIEARALNKDIYELTQCKAMNTHFKFKEQLRSSAGSIMDNIAEGFERGGNKELIQFLYIAKGSCGETRSQVHRAFDFKFIDTKTYQHLCEKCLQLSKRISSLINYLKNSTYKGNKYS
jgi:four helix bundle protein